MLRSLNSATAGLKAHQKWIDTTANNISNVNTVGYKSDEVNFKDMLYQSSKHASPSTATTGGTTSNQVGLGSDVGSVTKSVLKSGIAQSTGDPLDMMINGDSFFVTSHDGKQYYTRDGAFGLDSNGDLVMRSNGYYVNGWTSADGKTVNTTGAVGKLNFLQGQVDRTTNVTFEGNIDDGDADFTSGGEERSVKVTAANGAVYDMSMVITENGNGTYNLDVTGLKRENGDIVDVSGVGTMLLSYDYKTGDFISANGQTSGIVSTNIPQIGAVNFDFSKTTGISSLDENVSIKGSLPEWVTISNVDTDSGKTYLSDEKRINIPNEQGALVPYTASRIGFGDGFNKEELLGSGFYTTCCTCFAHYSILFKNGGGNSMRESGAHKIYSIDISEANTPEEVIDAIVAGINEIDGTTGDRATPNDHFTTLIKDPDDPTSLLVYDNRPGMDSGSGFGLIGRGYATKKEDDYNALTIVVSADGGKVNGFTVSKEGMVYATYGNGNRPRLVGQIAVADFANPYGLESAGGNMYEESQNSGARVIHAIDTTGGYLSVGVLEASNVDLADEFASTIFAQRGFQANSRVISVSDQMLERLRDLKQ